METTNFMALVTTATEKYTKMVDAAYKLKSKTNSEAEFDSLIKLVHSVYQDEIAMIYQYAMAEAKNEALKPKKEELKIPCFMTTK